MESAVGPLQVRIFDASQIQAEFSQCQDLSEIIQSLEKKCWQDGRVICEIHVNGLYLSEEDERRFAGTLLSDLNNLEIRTRDPEVLVDEALVSVQSWIPQIKVASLGTAQALQEGDLSGGLKKMKQIFEGCRWLSDALLLLKNLSLRGTESWTQDWARCERDFTALTRGLLSALESKDYVLVADQLEYDMSNVLDKWLELLQAKYTMAKEAPVFQK